MGILNSLFGKGPNIKEALEKGGQIVDVRSQGEFQGGNTPNSLNIPLNNLESKLSQFENMQKPIILCCASGNRSGQAERFLKSKNIDCLNGGSWTNVNNQL